MDMSMPEVTVAKRSDESRIASLMTLAFANDPVGREIYPDQLQFLTHFPEFVRLYGGRAFDFGCAHVTAGGRAAVLWLPPGENPDVDALIALFERSVSEAAKAEFFEAMKQTRNYHPEEPHWSLTMISVDPPHQGRGLGSALLAYGLAICDRERRLAYLDCSNPRNLPLYKRYGFEVLGTIEVGQFPPIFPMLRKPL
jgi:ribosomal protein S18 acetylase RimI-like enzyme